MVVATLAVFAQTGSFAFLNFDDPGFLTRNPDVQLGLRIESLEWAFTTLREGSYNPLTWLSHMAIVEWFGLDPAAHHLANVALHLLNVALLYWFLASSTDQKWHALIAVLLFAVHPMRAESVAWVSERKDVLSGTFFIASLILYARYAQSNGQLWWGATFASYALGLLAKPMVITLPFVLLLLDYWPLRRTWIEWRARVLEKVPFVVLGLLSGVVTLFGQHRVGAMQDPARVSFGARIANACVSYVAYVGQWVWPAELSIFHPLRAVPAGLAAGCALALIVTSIALWRLRVRAPALGIGWCWYLVTLLPVIGLVQVGGQARADRYLYLPSIGLGIALVWGVPMLLRGVAWATPARQLAASGCVIAALGVWAFVQVGVFRDSETVWRHALDVEADNFMAHNNLSVELTSQGRFAEAEEHVREAVRLNPTYPLAQANLANALARRGQYAEALAHYDLALQRQPESPETHYNLGLTFARLGRYEEAAAQYREALSMKPTDAMAHYSFGALLVGLGKQLEGLEHLRRAVALQPDWSEPRAMLERVERTVSR